MANESRKNIKNERNFFAWWRSRISEFRVKWNLFMNYSNVVDDIITEHTERKAMEKFHFPCSNFHPRCATFTFKLDASGGLLMRFSTFHRSTNTLWQFNYNISLFQLVPIDFFPGFLFFRHFSLPNHILALLQCGVVLYMCTIHHGCWLVHQQAIHVVSHTCKERERKNRKWNEFVWSQLFNYVWQLEIFCLFLHRFGGCKESLSGLSEKFMPPTHNRGGLEALSKNK